VWFYEELAKRVGKSKYYDILHKIGYGNDAFVEHDGDDFWNFGNFKVTPIEQVELLVQLHEETLPFSAQTFEVVKSLMVEEQSKDFILRAKSGWSYDGIDNGWYVGYLESESDIWFFATRITKKLNDANPNFSKCRKVITLKLLDLLTADQE